MANRFAARWVGNACAILALAGGGCADARSLRVEGVAHFDDGAPVQGAVVVFRQLHGVLYGRSKSLGSTMTDSEGRFDASFDAVKGSLDIELRRQPCAWSGAVELIDVSNRAPGTAGDSTVHYDGQLVTVDLVVHREFCSPEPG